jgi:hypothetical protein
MAEGVQTDPGRPDCWPLGLSAESATRTGRLESAEAIVDMRRAC